VKPLLVIDAANVIGSVPDGWWRDRRGANERLRDRLARQDHGDVDLLLVVEGQAKDIQAISGVPVQSAAGSGDDTIVEVVRRFISEREVTVITADRGLRARVEALGAKVAGPKSLNEAGPLS
jgi:hypothetical protein